MNWVWVSICTDVCNTVEAVVDTIVESETIVLSIVLKTVDVIVCNTVETAV